MVASIHVTDTNNVLTNLSILAVGRDRFPSLKIGSLPPFKDTFGSGWGFPIDSSLASCKTSL